MLTTPGSFEATARTRYLKEDWEGSFVSCRDWLRDQPFSARPAIQLTYLAATPLGRLEDAISYGNLALIPNPKDATLLNNLAFAYASSGQTTEAETVLGRVEVGRLADHEKIIVEATRGLIAFRKGNHELGRALYESAISLASSDSDNQRFVEWSHIYRSREEIMANTDRSGEALDTLRAIARRTSNPIAKLVTERILAAHTSAGLCQVVSR
jgi:tetratricopeptide (TPR) repeat protein